MKTNVSGGESLWQSEMVLGEDYWEIDIVLAQHESKESATKVAELEATDATFVLVEGVPAIQVSVNGLANLYFDSDVIITEVSAEKQASMGRPLDMTNVADQNIAVEALLARDPSYIIEGEDMVPSGKTLEYFLQRYGAGYRPDNIAWGVSPVLPCEAVKQ